METYNQRYQNQLLAREKVFRDPVHDYIHIQDGLILQLINAREFQRLRRIRQLGTASYTFHGAEHSRFNHSLGVYEITRRIINNFSRNYPSVEEGDGLWLDSERLIALSAALLHDVGHGPFSHTFEGIFNTDHEFVTQQIILSPDTEINQILKTMGDDFPEKVASVINHTYPNQQVVHLISSQIDADRMDYLIRDAYYTGVSYGNFDLTRILRVIRPLHDKIVFDYSGMHAVEDYVVRRYQMYMQVYFHPVSRGMEEVLSNLLNRAKYCYETKPDKMKNSIELLGPLLNNNWTLEDYLRLDDHVMSTYFTYWLEEDDEILADLAGRFLNRKPFKSLLATDESIEELSIALHNELVTFGLDSTYYFGENSSFDLPYDFYRPSSKSNRTQIEFFTKNQQIIELSQVSSLVASLTGEERGDHRLYFPRELLHYLYNLDHDQLNPNQEKILSAHKEENNDITYNTQERLF